ncbi:hypothetical protein ACN261_31595 [Micromonospora sp. WMMD723]|uniref:hypothetical protein n=1 Tax=Micromonospora sp. WMMD723 TaxID=3403465 RepID=UPI003CF1B4A9
MSLNRDQAAQALGMKTREIIAVDRVDGGYTVTTHDGRRTLVNAAGSVIATGDVLNATGATPAPPVDPVGSVPSQPGTPDQPLTELEAQVPDRTVPDVLAWVGTEPDRAAAAAAVERRRDRPRTGLLDELDKRAAATPGTGGGGEGTAS